MEGHNQIQWVCREISDSRYTAMSYSDSCAICRCCLEGPCIGCKKGQFSSALSVMNRGRHRDMLFALLLVRQRYIPTLPRDIVKHILNLAWREHKRWHKLECTWHILPTCGHIYHSHCLERWLRKRSICPLDSYAVDGEDMKPEYMVMEAIWAEGHLQIDRVMVKKN